jgi:predicted nucleic-acid-binding protein
MKEFLLDANVLVRFFVQDDPKQSPAATALFEKAERREVLLHLDALAVAETVYVLIGRCGRSRTEIVDVLLAIIQNAGIEVMEEEIVTDALQRFAAFNVDFSDAWLAARSDQLRRPVASFDRDLDKFKDIKRFEPTTLL